MIILPYQINPTEFNILVALDREEREQILEYNPVGFDMQKLGEDFKELRLRSVYVTYATMTDLAKCQELSQTGRDREIVPYLSRGRTGEPNEYSKLAGEESNEKAN